jgi:hypothetical protein
MEIDKGFLTVFSNLNKSVNILKNLEKITQRFIRREKRSENC